MRVLILTLACLVGAAPLAAKEKPPTTYQIPLPPKPDFSEVDWLVGEWSGSTTERKAPGEIRLSVSYELDHQVMLLRGEASFQATQTSPAMKESWMGVLTSDRGAAGFLLCTFSSTGFITRYRVTVEGPETHLNPEGGEQPPPGWLFRTVIKRTDPQEFIETVQAAPPNKSFFDYYTAKLSRVRVEEKAKDISSHTPIERRSSMSRRKKVILGILIFLVVTLAVLVVVVPLFFDVDRYRPQVASLIEKQTGKPVEIGHLALTFFPSLSIRVDNFALHNPSGFPPGYFVKAQRIYAVIDAGGLWHHQVVIKSVDLDAPAINLLSDVKGNWNFESKPSPAPADPDPPGEKPLFTLGVISNLKITKGKISAATLLPSGGPGPVIFEADGFSSQLRKVDLNAFTASASVNPHAVPRELEAVPATGWLTSAAYALDQSGKLAAEGTVKMDSLHVMNLVLTDVKTNLRLFPQQVFLDGLDFKCYDGQVAGNLSFWSAGQTAHYNTDAKLDGVNVAKLLDAFPDARGKMTGTLEGSVKLDGEVIHSPDPLAGIRGAGHTTIRKGKLPGLQWNTNLLQLAQLAKMGPASGDPGSFSSIAIDFTIANNRINTPKATIVGNGVDVNASGSLGLAGAGSLDYQGVAKVAVSQNALTSVLAGMSGATVANGKMVFPFKLAGTLQNPKFTLDTGRRNR